MRTITVGRFYNLDILITPVGVVSLLILWVVLAFIGVNLLSVTTMEAVLGGLAGAIIFLVLETTRQLGHAWAARRTGYPMTGIRFYSMLSACLYPSDEPPLPGKTHIRRALGGPLFSLITSVVTGVLALLLGGAEGGLPGWLALFAFVVNFFVLTLGAFLPLGFTDGSTLLKYWGKS